MGTEEKRGRLFRLVSGTLFVDDVRSDGNVTWPAYMLSRPHWCDGMDSEWINGAGKRRVDSLMAFLVVPTIKGEG